MAANVLFLLKIEANAYVVYCMLPCSHFLISVITLYLEDVLIYPKQ